MKRSLFLISVCCLVLLLAASSAAADAPVLSADDSNISLGYSGYLADAGGVAINGLINMRFRLYTGAVSGTALYDSGILTAVSVDEGIFDVTLNVPASLFDGRDLWLSVQVDGETLSPRQPLTAVPYAAGVLPGASIQASGGTALSVASDSGVGLSGSSNSGVGIAGQSTGTGGSSYGGSFTSTSAAGVYAASSADPSQANAYAPGVYAYSENGVGLMAGTASETYPAVLGTSESGIALKGQANSGYALYGTCTTGTAVYGASTDTGYGGYFSSSNGTALQAVSESEAGVVGESETNSGVVGQSGQSLEEPSVGKIGVQGLGQDVGVMGTSKDGKGVVGTSTNSYAVQGLSTNSYGAYLASENSYGAYITSNTYRGLYAAGGYGSWAAYLDGSSSDGAGLYVNGITTMTGDLTVMGDLTVEGSKSGYLVDLAMNVGETPLHQGDVVVIVGVGEPVLGDIPLLLIRACTEANSTAVVGVVDERVVLDEATEENGEVLESESILTGEYVNVVTSGTFGWINVDASSASIAPGDLLVSSSNPGLAMVSTAPSPGTVIGKALGTLEEGAGTIPVLVTLD